MKRCFIALTAVVLALAGCGRSTGTDGDLANGWATPGAATFFAPVVGHCYDNSDEGEQHMAIVDFQDMPCAVQHDEEVVAVHTLSGDAPFSPRSDSGTVRSAWQGCATAANAYLGGDWHDALAEPEVVMPNDGEWLAGERTYACTVVGQNTPNGTTMFMYYRNGLAGARPVARTCFTFAGSALDKDGYFTELSTSAATACGSSHDAEYVASFQADDTATEPATGSAQYQADWQRCVAAASTFLGRSVTDVQHRTDIEPYLFLPRGNAWSMGDHSFACYVAVPSSREVSRSLKGIGAGSPT